MISSSKLNQIFYKHNKFDNPDSIESLFSYFLTLNKKNEIFSIIEGEKEILYQQQQFENTKKPEIQEITENVMLSIPDILLNNNNNNKINKKKSYYEPSQTDSLFWCIYIHVYGYSDYLQIGHRYGNSELNEKQKIIEFIKKNPKKIKDTKFKVSKGLTEEIISEFMVMNNKTTLLGLIALSVYYNISFFIVNKNKNIYLKYEPNDYTGLPCIIYKTNNKYVSEMETTAEIVNNIKDTMLCLETINKPLKSISNYKSNELSEIALKLNIELPEKIKKNEVFQKISEYCII